MDSVSENGAKEVLSQLERHGYFLNYDVPSREENDQDDSFEAYQRWTQKQENTPTNSTWRLIPTMTDGNDNASYFTPEGLARHLVGRLQQGENSGRASLPDLCREAQVDHHLFSAASHLSLWDQLVKESELFSVTILGTNKSGTLQSVELVSVAYWESTLEKIIAIVEEQGRVSISDLTTEYSLSREAILNHLIVNGRIDGRIRFMNDSKDLVSASHCRSLQQIVLKYFAGLEEPVQINTVCQEQKWDWNQVSQWLTDQLEDQNQTKDNDETAETFLKGEIHADAATCSQTAMYLPFSYRKRQQQEILDFLSANGYITMDRAVRNYRQGLLAAQITTLINEAFPGVTILNSGNVFITDSVLQQVQVGVQDYLSSSSVASGVLDLQEYLPEELLQSSAIVLNILETIGFTSPTDGVAVTGNDRAIIVSKEIIKHIKENDLSQLIQKHARKRANEIFLLEFALDEEDNDNEDAEGPGRKSGKSTKSKRKGKSSKQSKKKDKLPKADESSCLVPFLDVVLSVMDACSDFQEDSLSPEDLKAENLKWEDDDDISGDPVLVAQFCRKAFYSDSLKEQCQIAVKAELQRLESEKNSKARMSRKDAAAKVRSVEAAFQDAFVTLCYLVQAQAKTINYFANSLEDCFDQGSLEILIDEFLQGPCADLTSRITQHCLFQEEAEEDCMFTFIESKQERGENTENDEETELSSVLPRYCADVTITSRSHPKSYLSSPPPREPLPMLRESFSTNTGIVLAKMWILCGGECYRGGVRTIGGDEGEVSSQSVHVRPGNMDGFLSYAEENCLTLCGLPYKKLDKKTEKSLLFSRKQQLNGLLASTDVTRDPIGVLEYTIMILFQQVRSVIVSGSLLRGPMIEALSKERKIPSSVAVGLKLLSEMIKDDSKPVDETLATLVKECGLVRDISKHDTTAIESFLSDHETKML